jgi:hypothetical protein
LVRLTQRDFGLDIAAVEEAGPRAYVFQLAKGYAVFGEQREQPGLVFARAPVER